jgi:hypothetical protein
MSEQERRDVNIKLAQIIEQIEMAQEIWLDGDRKECLLLLQGAIREIKKVTWRVMPVLGDE